MRVLHVAEVAHGGVVTLVRTFAAHQVEAGLDVHLLLPPGVDGEGTVHRWQPRRGRPYTYPAAVRRLRGVLRDVEPDVVHLHSFFPGLFGRMLPVPTRTAVVYQPHSWAFQATTSPVARRAVTRWECWATARTSTLITNCHDELAEAQAEGLTGPATVVGLPVDTDYFSPVPDADRARIRADLGISANRLLVCVGRLSRQKGQDLLAAAWERRPVPDTALVFVGPGDPAEVTSLAPRSIGRSLHVVGPQTDVRSWIRAADVCVQPSLYEGQSVAMAEALACGRPVVMTEVNGANEAICPPGQVAAGAVVRVGDMEALLSACAERLGSSDRLAVESAAARDRAVSLFRAQDVLRRINHVYSDAAAHTYQGD